MKTSEKNKTTKILLQLTEELFGLVKAVGGIMDEIAFTPYGQLRINKIPRTTYYSKLRKFEQAGLVKKVRKDYGNVFVLSDKAKNLRKQPTNKIERKDGLSTLIMFDIPESKHKARDNFRRYLIRNGYTQIQKSAFLSPFKISSELLEFIKELDIRSNVSFLSGKVDYPE